MGNNNISTMNTPKVNNLSVPKDRHQTIDEKLIFNAGYYGGINDERLKTMDIQEIEAKLKSKSAESVAVAYAAIHAQGISINNHEPQFTIKEYHSTQTNLSSAKATNLEILNATRAKAAANGNSALSASTPAGVSSDGVRHTPKTLTDQVTSAKDTLSAEPASVSLSKKNFLGIGGRNSVPTKSITEHAASVTPAKPVVVERVKEFYNIDKSQLDAIADLSDSKVSAKDGNTLAINLKTAIENARITGQYETLTPTVQKLAYDYLHLKKQDDSSSINKAQSGSINTGKYISKAGDQLDKMNTGNQSFLTKLFSQDDKDFGKQASKSINQAVTTVINERGAHNNWVSNKDLIKDDGKQSETLKSLNVIGRLALNDAVELETKNDFLALGNTIDRSIRQNVAELNIAGLERHGMLESVKDLALGPNIQGKSDAAQKAISTSHEQFKSMILGYEDGAIKLYGGRENIPKDVNDKIHQIKQGYADSLIRNTENFIASFADQAYKSRASAETTNLKGSSTTEISNLKINLQTTRTAMNNMYEMCQSNIKDLELPQKTLDAKSLDLATHQLEQVKLLHANMEVKVNTKSRAWLGPFTRAFTDSGKSLGGMLKAELSGFATVAIPAGLIIGGVILAATGMAPLGIMVIGLGGGMIAKKVWDGAQTAIAAQAKLNNIKNMQADISRTNDAYVKTLEAKVAKAEGRVEEYRTANVAAETRTETIRTETPATPKMSAEETQKARDTLHSFDPNTKTSKDDADQKIERQSVKQANTSKANTLEGGGKRSSIKTDADEALDPSNPFFEGGDE